MKNNELKKEIINLLKNHRVICQNPRHRWDTGGEECSLPLQLLALIDKHTQEMVGEDEKVDLKNVSLKNLPYSLVQIIKAARNALRAKQRQALSDIREKVK